MNIMKESKKPRLAIIVSRFPFPLEKGDKLRIYYQIKELSQHYSITLLAISDIPVKPEYLKELEKFCDTVHIFYLKRWMIFLQLFTCLFRKLPYQVAYFYDPLVHQKIKAILNELQPDHIYCQLIRVSEYVKDHHSCRKTLDYMDALSKGIERRIDKASFWSRWLFRSEAQRLSRYEQRIFTYFENKTIISEQDRDLIMHPDRRTIIAVPNGIDLKFFDQQNQQAEYDLVFVGNLSYAPNIEAVQFLGRMMQKAPGINCLISGANPSVVVKKVVSQHPNMQLQGWVEDIRSAYSKGRIFIAPMMIGTGMQNKLLEAMALGIPCITTPLANNAIKGTHLENILVAESMEEFIQFTEKLLLDPALAKSIGLKGSEYVRANYTWSGSTKLLHDLIKT
jgi:polysaccharide biosynthesis protein PslH